MTALLIVLYIVVVIIALIYVISQNFTKKDFADVLPMIILAIAFNPAFFVYGIIVIIKMISKAAKEDK